MYQPVEVSYSKQSCYQYQNNYSVPSTSYELAKPEDVFFMWFRIIDDEFLGSFPNMVDLLVYNNSEEV